MKKYIGQSKIWFLLLLLVTIVTGCGEHNNESGKAVTAYALGGVGGTINEPAKSIAVTVPNGTNVTALVATFTTSPGSSVKVGTVTQTSATTANNFTAPVAYTVTAEDNSTEVYTVTVTVAPISAKVMTAYSFAGFSGALGTINQTDPKTIAVTVPNGTNLTALVATFATTGSSVKVGTTVQTSALTANDFSAPLAYTVTAADGSSVIYTVTVIAAANSAKVMTAYSFAGISGATGTINQNAPKTIAVTVPTGTNLTALVATFTTTGSSVKVGTTVQTSTVSDNDFTTPQTYTVIAADGTSVDYVVTVKLAVSANISPDAPVLGEAGRFVILASQTITTTGASVISNGDMGILDQARSYLTSGGYTPGLNPGEFTQLANGLSYASDDSNTIATAPYATPYPYPLKTATVVIGSAWATTLAMIDQSRTDLGIAYQFLAGTNPAVPTQTLASTQLGGQILTPGVYYTSANVLITTGALQLDALGDPDAVWIFTIDGSLTAGAPSGAISFVSGVGSAKNVYWRTGGDTVIETGITFLGNVFAQTQINVLGGANVTGSLFALTNQVTLGDATVTKAP